MTPQELNEGIKRYLDVQVGHFKIDWDRHISKLTNYSTSEIEHLRTALATAIPKYSAKKKKQLEKQAERFLEKIRENLNESERMKKTLYDLLVVAIADLSIIKEIINKITQERYDYIDFLKKCTDIEEE